MLQKYREETKLTYTELNVRSNSINKKKLNFPQIVDDFYFMKIIRLLQVKRKHFSNKLKRI